MHSVVLLACTGFPLLTAQIYNASNNVGDIESHLPDPIIGYQYQQMPPTTTKGTFNYRRKELDLFDCAVNEKHYLAEQLRPFIRGDVE
jgi:hypothetical protein